MKYKYAFLLFISSFLIKAVILIDVIPKYGKKTTYDSSIFLDVSGFEKDEKIYISITTDNYYHYYSSSFNLRYNFYETINGVQYFSAISSVSYSSSSSVNYRETYNYKIKKTDANSNYLYLQYNDFPLPVTIENTENDATTTLIIVIVIVLVVIIAIIIAIIVCYCRRCRRAAVVTPVVYPSNYGYGISPYGVQQVVPVVQPVMQPVVQQVASVQPYGTSYPQQNPNYNNYNNYTSAPNIQYGQIPQNQTESDYRINNNNIKYEKPM